MHNTNVTERNVHLPKNTSNSPARGTVFLVSCLPASEQQKLLQRAIKSQLHQLEHDQVTDSYTFSSVIFTITQKM